MEPESAAITKLWEDFKATGSMDDRNRLVVHYSPLVKYVAGRLSAGLPNSIEQADLVSYGMFGLIDAINKFEPARGFKFETYAMSRIRGSIIDELRSIDWVPRSLRAKARAVEKAYTKLEHELLRTPTDAEVADELGTTEEELQNVFTQISFFGLVALEETVSVGADRSESVTLGDTIPDAGLGPGRRLRGRGDEADPRPGHQPPARAGEDRPHPLLLRGPDPGRDRRHPRHHREPGVPDPHQGRASSCAPSWPTPPSARLG